MKSPEELIRVFYTAFQQRDWSTMQSCYHPDARFSDPVFTDLNGKQVRAMWHMLTTAGSSLRIEFSRITTDTTRGTCHWEAWYTFSGSGRAVHNVIDARFTFADGLIVTHTDHFDLYRWCRQALGPAGLLLGWTSWMHNKIRKKAAGNLARFVEKHPVYQ
ncbi:MAG: nuclear transport factor 2 family protein [Cyclobacteriaceae bacterium]|nr:nuclear transport factor 2 family protein [Cyclobacteriaceae bacterium]